MFEKEELLTKSDFASREFILYGGDFLGETEHAEYGKNVKATVTVSGLGRESQADRKEFVVYGVLADQVRRVESGDLPAVARIGKDGRANVFQFVRKPTEEDLIPF